MSLIEREAALEICEKEYQGRLRMLDYCGDTVAWNIGNAIKTLPIIDAVPVVHGRWEEDDWVEPDGHSFGTVRIPKAGLRCNQCANVFRKKLLWKDNFCPNCGARMDGGDGHEAD